MSLTYKVNSEHKREYTEKYTERDLKLKMKKAVGNVIARNPLDKRQTLKRDN